MGPRVIGCVPVICACWAMRTEGSRAMEEGFGSIDVRFGAVEERRSGAGRAGVGCDDMVGVEVGSVGLKFGRDGDDASSVAWEV